MLLPFKSRIVFGLAYFLLMVLWGCMMSYEIKHRKDKVMITLDGILVILYGYLCIAYVVS